MESMDENKKTDAGAVAAEKAVKSDYKKQKGEKKRSFNIVDIVLILMILTFAVIVVFFFAPNADFHWGTGQNVQLEYTVEISGISKEMAAKIGIGDQVFDGENNYAVGSVTNTEIDDCVEYIYNEASGRIEAVSYADEGDAATVRKTMLITITADAKYTPGSGYTVNGYRIAVNREMVLCFPGYTGEGQCVSVTILETEDK